jgi:hypothetical protein
MHSYTLCAMLESGSARQESSWIDQAQSHFDDANAALVMQTRALLSRIVGDEALHPKLINTLSMLEHMGSHKIMLTQHGPELDQPTLKHLAEECHHAYFMKRQAEKAAGRALAYVPADLLAPRAVRMYFQRLEASLVRSLERERSVSATYLYMSMIVEFRAVWFYSLYQSELKRNAHAMSLKRLLGEEQNHLTDMAERLEHAGELSDARVDAFVRTEHSLYGRLLDSLQQSLN